MQNNSASNSTLLVNLHAGYIETRSVYADMRQEAQPGLDLVEMQISLLRTEVRQLFDGAQMVRMYGLSKDFARESPQVARLLSYLKFRDKAFDLKFSDSFELLEFLADSGRLKSRLRGHQVVLPSYDDLLCFFPLWETIPLGWWRAAPAVLYLTNPFKGMNRNAKAELQKYLKENQSGAVIRICLTAFRSSIFIFPGSSAADPLWERLRHERFGAVGVPSTRPTVPSNHPTHDP